MTKSDGLKIFISYNRADRRWAEWIAWKLEEAGHEAIFQPWDFGAGSNFVLEMQRATEEADRTIAVLSQSYLEAMYTQPEWAAALARDPTGAGARLIPVRVSPCEPKGMLATIVTVDLVTAADEEKAAAELLAAVVGKRRKPAAAPVSPWARAAPAFPSTDSDQVTADWLKDKNGVRGVPDFPPHYLARPEYLERLKKALLLGDQTRVGLTGHGKIGVQGMGGIGKTILAAAVAREPEVHRAFRDGMVWITVGQEPSLLQLQQDLAAIVGASAPDGPGFVFRTEHQGKLLLQRALNDRNLLLVLDDVWAARHAWFLDVVGPAGRLLVTTRNREVLVALGAEELQIEVLNPEQARSLLADWADQPASELPEIADRVAEACGYLPLALAMIGAMVRLEPTAWGDALERLERADLDKIRQDFPGYPYPDLLRTLEVSVKALEPKDRERYLELAVFSEDVAVPQEAVEVLWSVTGLDELDVRELFRRLEARSLVRRDEAGHLTLHDLQGDYIRRQADDLQALHGRLIDAYRERCPEGLASGPDDGYLFEWIPHHLVKAGRENDLRQILTYVRWLERKLHGRAVQALIGDFDKLSAEDPLRRVQDALRLAAHVLVRDPKQLRSQLLGRLLGEDSEVISHLLEGIKKSTDALWLRPLRRSLEPPGGPLLQILEGHAAGVNTVEVLPTGRLISASDDKTLRVWDISLSKSLKVLEGHTAWVLGVALMKDGRVVTASDDGTLRVWDPSSNKTLQILKGHESGVTSVAVLVGDRLVSGSDDRTLRVWDLSSGESLRTLEGHTAEIMSVAVLANGRVVSASRDCTLRVWDPSSGKSLRTLEGHTSGVRGVTPLANGRVISASHDRTLREWDPSSGESIQTLKGHTAAVMDAAELSSGRVVSASADRTLRVWDLASGECLQTLEGHTAWIRGVATLADGRVVSASDDGTLRIWRTVPSGRSQVVEGHADEVRDVAVLADGRVVSASTDSTLRIWGLSGKEPQQILKGHTAWVRSVAVLADGRVVSASSDRTLRVWDPSSGRSIQTLVGHSSGVLGVTTLTDGQVVSASADGTLRVWDLVRGKTLRILQGHTAWVTGVAVLADGRVISASADCTLKLWNPSSGEALMTFTGHTAGVNSVAVLADCRIISASEDRTLRVWDPTSGASRRTLEGHGSGVLGVAVLQGGRALSVSLDHTLRAWNVDTGLNLATFTADAPMTCVAAETRSEVVVAGDLSGRLHYLRLEEPAT